MYDLQLAQRSNFGSMLSYETETVLAFKRPDASNKPNPNPLPLFAMVQVMPAPSLSRSKYPAPLDFDNNTNTNWSDYSTANHIKPDKDQHEHPPYQDRASDNTLSSFIDSPRTTMFDRNNSGHGHGHAAADSAYDGKEDIDATFASIKSDAGEDGLLSSSRAEDVSSESPSPIEIHHPLDHHSASLPIFPHPFSAPHSQEHFQTHTHTQHASSGSSSNTEMNRYNPPERYLRTNTHPQSHHNHPGAGGGGVDKYILDQRRMSEPSLFGGSSGSTRYPQQPQQSQQHGQFAFNPPPLPSPRSPQFESNPYSYSPQRHSHSSHSWKGSNHGEDQHHNMHIQQQLHAFSSLGFRDGDSRDGEEPISPLNPAFSPSMGGLGIGGLGAGHHGYAGDHDAYGPSPPNTGTSATSSNNPRGSTSHSNNNSNSKTYSFVSLPGNAVKKRPRRRYDEIERLYQCSWPECAKAYGTLNHLNAHVTMQKHGSKRSPNEFKELRKQWRKAKKEEDMSRSQHHHLSHSHTYPHPHSSSHHSMRRSSLQHPEDLQVYPRHHRAHHGGAHPYHHPQLAVPSIGPDGRYAAINIADIRYPPPGTEGDDELDSGSRFRANPYSGRSTSGGGPWPATASLPSRISTLQNSYMPQQGLPTNASISLNLNPTSRLGPDSTLLTPLSGYEVHPLQSHSHSPLDMYGGYEDDRDRPSTGHSSVYEDTSRPGTGRSLYDVDYEGGSRPGTGGGDGEFRHHM